MLFTVELAERYGKDGLVALSLHPGGIHTPLQRYFTDKEYEFYRNLIGAYNEDNTPNIGSGIWKTIEQGASTTLVAAFDPAKAMLNGAYLYDCQLRDTSEVQLEKVKPYAMDKNAAKRLWIMTEEMIDQTGR